MMKRKLSVMAAAAATVALLAGCVNLAPEHQRPEAPVAPQWPQGPGAEAADAKAATELQWQQFFRDERLKQLIDLALKNNRDLRVALLNVDVARAQANVTAANRWPTVNLGLSAQRGPQTTSSGDSQIVSVYQAGLQVTSYELDLFSRVKNQSAAAFAQYLATDEAARSARISLVAGVAQAYLAVQADEEARLKLAPADVPTEGDKISQERINGRITGELGSIISNQVDAPFSSTISGNAYKIASSPRGIRYPTFPHNDKAGWARVNYVRDLPDGRRFANDSRGFLYRIDPSN